MKTAALLFALVIILSGCRESPLSPPREILNPLLHAAFDNEFRRPIHATSIVNQYTMRVDGELRTFYHVVAFAAEKDPPLTEDGRLHFVALQRTISCAKRGTMWYWFPETAVTPTTAAYQPSADELNRIQAALARIREVDEALALISPEYEAARKRLHDAVIDKPLFVYSLLEQKLQSDEIDRRLKLAEQQEEAARASFNPIDERVQRLKTEKSKALSAVFPSNSN